jgi:hypothetical protein
MSSKAGAPEIRVWSESAEKSELTLPSIGRGNQSLLSFSGHEDRPLSRSEAYESN